jgi:hypothetical protein
MKSKITLHIFSALTALTLWSGFTSCKKLIQVTPTAAITQSLAYTDSTSAAANVTGIYYQLQQAGVMYSEGYYCDYPLLSDEAAIGSSASSVDHEFSLNVITTSDYLVSGLWSNNYSTIYQANSVIENISAMTTLSSAQRNLFLGQARFVRAYCYFILMQYFGKVPLATGTDYKVNDALSRSDTSVVDAFIVNELLAADSLLPSGYTAFGGVKTQACKETAEALLARVYLYRKDWAGAATYATLLISSPLFSMPADYATVLESNSPESIWEIWASDVSYAYENFTASILLPVTPTATTLPATIPSAKLVSSFEPGDARKSAYLAYNATGNYYYVYKYRDNANGTDQPKILRLSEMYLIRAEAYAEMNELSAAAADINVIRGRAGLGGTPALAQSTLLAAVAQERFVELCFEGHRWLDLLRTGQANAVMGAYRPTTWTSTALLLPIPGTELSSNPNLLPQNTGY